jgi:16S rRNA (uracil1498-N3)-methyltransferase
MTLRRWIADDYDFEANRAALTGQNAAHLACVLRAEPGMQFEVACGTVVHRGRVATVSPERVTFELEEVVPSVASAEVVLWLAVFKFDRFEWAIEKCTELDVKKIQPVIAQRTDVHLASASVKRVERWRRIAHEAAQQSRRAAIPEIAIPQTVKSLLAADAHHASQKILLAETERTMGLRSALKPGAAKMLATGPEGGWTKEELGEFNAANWTPVSLGPTILRAETAAIAAVSLAVLG